MRLNFSELLPKSGFLVFFILLTGFVNAGFANAPDKTVGIAKTELLIEDIKGSEFRLEVRQKTLSQVFDNIAKKTNVPIHYSALPEGLVTATCVGSTLVKILECVLNRKADLIVRFPRNAQKADVKGQVAEAWVLGSRLDSEQKPAANCTAGVSGQPIGNGEESLQPEANATATEFNFVAEDEEDGRDGNNNKAKTSRISDLLQTAKSKNPLDRAEAIGDLLAEEDQDNPEIKAALEQALNDQDANVRAQAVSSLAHREGEDAVGVIQDALHDNSVDVRLMAVDSITADIALLQQAKNDSDETVRSLATVKLQQLNAKN